MELSVAVVSAVAGIVGAWFAYVAVRGRVRRSPVPTTGRNPAGDHFDAVISYATEDEDRATWLATGLTARGRRVFLARWIDVGLVEYAEKENALATTANGILLFGRTTMSEPAIQDHYAGVREKNPPRGNRFVPVLVDPVTLPPYARIRRLIDLTDPRNDECNLDRLARAISPP